MALASLLGMVCFMSLDNELPGDDNVYRVHIDLTTNTVGVVCIGMEAFDSKLEGSYPSVDALPKWMQERIALLMMVSLDKPTRVIEGVGRRISANIFWVVRPEC